MQGDADIAVLARVGGGHAFAGAGHVLAEADGDEGAAFDDVGAGAAGWAAGADPRDLYKRVSLGDTKKLLERVSLTLDIDLAWIRCIAFFDGSHRIGGCHGRKSGDNGSNELHYC